MRVNVDCYWRCSWLSPAKPCMIGKSAIVVLRWKGTNEEQGWKSNPLLKSENLKD